MSKDAIFINEYNPDWPGLFQKEKTFLAKLLPQFATGTIEHVGSTSVPGLAAKPVIDIMLGVKTLADSREAITLLSANGYCYYPYKSNVMHWFCKPTPDIRTHHLHLIPFNSPLWLERLAFRDHLRKNPQVAKEYSELKRKLAREHKEDRELYTQKKWPFIQAQLTKIKEGSHAE
ncbi:GrpB family protein [Thalassomonas haliotis]|uniref:GrpB family protein n=1 Tax=Thalassomonas haliotis TaxID=485448 RepID=A0ABY7VD58_9GAMM|nr:GrpB family protein [Thalassomonas haliotis]WDE11582.1 GrpB family protein [Thalassomonas haliotis]